MDFFYILISLNFELESLGGADAVICDIKYQHLSGDSWLSPYQSWMFHQHFASTAYRCRDPITREDPLAPEKNMCT